MTNRYEVEEGQPVCGTTQFRAADIPSRNYLHTAAAVPVGNPYAIYPIELTAEQIADCSHVGDCAEDCEYWLSRIPSIAAIPREHIARHLREYGAWDTKELQDDGANQIRLLWVAAGHCREEKETVYYVD